MNSKEVHINDLSNLINNNNIQNLIHVGAHKGDEIELYNNCGIKKIVWIEALPDLIDEIKKNTFKYNLKIDNTILNYAVSDKKENNINFYKYYKKNSNNYGLSSLLEINKNGPWAGRLKNDTKLQKIISVSTNTLSNILIENNISTQNIDLLLLDTQGSELKILKGFNELSNVKHIYLEYSTKMFYSDSCLLNEINTFLESKNFKIDNKYKYLLFNEFNNEPDWKKTNWNDCHGNIIYHKI